MTRKQPRAKVGVIGLGVIGSRVAACLRGAGHQVYVWNRSPRAEPHFLGSAVEVAELSDLLQLFVSDDAALLATIRTIAPVLGARHVVAGHATVSPETAREAAALVHECGARYLDAPFTGSKLAAQGGQLVYFVAGPEAALREARPIFEASARALVAIGGAPGQASAVKLATNMVIAQTLQGLAEALALARAAGVDPAQFAEALENSPARSGVTEGKLPGMIKGNFEPHFALKHLFKDLSLALGLASVHGVTLPATATVAAAAYGGVKRGWGEQDSSALARHYEPLAPAAPVALPAPPRALPAPPPASETPAPLPVEQPSAEAEVAVQDEPAVDEEGPAPDSPPASAPPQPRAFPPVEEPPPVVPVAETTPVAAVTVEMPAPPPAEIPPPAAPRMLADAAKLRPSPLTKYALATAGKPVPHRPMKSPSMLPPVARREHPDPTPARTPPPAFPFAPPSSGPQGSAEETPAAPDAEPVPSEPPELTSPTPPAPRRSIFAALFGKDK